MVASKVGGTGHNSFTFVREIQNEVSIGGVVVGDQSDGAVGIAIGTDCGAGITGVSQEDGWVNSWVDL